MTIPTPTPELCSQPASLLGLFAARAQRAVEAISWTGSVLGVCGALTLAVNTPWSGIGWYFFLASNAAWIAYAFLKRVPSLLLMQAVFTITSLIGILRWSA